VTIINATRQGDRAHIITDAAWTDNATGCLTHIASKYIVGNAFPFIIAPTGNPNPFSLNAAIEAERPRNGRQLLEVLPKILRQMDAESKIPLDAGFVIATWDKRAGRPMLHLIANTETHWPGVMPPFELYWIEHVIGGEVPVDEALGRFRAKSNDGLLAAFAGITASANAETLEALENLIREARLAKDDPE